MRGAWRGDSRGVGLELYKILDPNFGELTFHALQCISIYGIGSREEAW